jgi:hypothetical protein
MKASTSHRKVASKGDRLNWTPLKDVKPVQLNKNLVKGKQVTLKELHKSLPSIAKRKVLVP